MRTFEICPGAKRSPFARDDTASQRWLGVIPAVDSVELPVSCKINAIQGGRAGQGNEKNVSGRIGQSSKGRLWPRGLEFGRAHVGE